MQSGNSFTTVDDAFDKGICQKQEKPSSKLTFSKFENIFEYLDEPIL